MTEAIGIQEFHNDDTGYLQWTRQNRRGYVLNISDPKTGWGLLHKSDCMYIADYAGRDYSLTNTRKVCAPSSASLEAWADEHGVEWGRCSTCLG